MAEGLSKRVKRKPIKRRPASDEIFYAMAIESWNWRFSFGIGGAHSSNANEDYHDYRHLTLIGRLVYPAKMKGRNIQFTLVPSVINHRPGQPQPVSIGSLHTAPGLIEGAAISPADAMEAIITMLATDRTRYLTIEGTKVNPRQVDITSYSMEMRWEDDGSA